MYDTLFYLFSLAIFENFDRVSQNKLFGTKWEYRVTIKIMKIARKTV